MGTARRGGGRHLDRAVEWRRWEHTAAIECWRRAWFEQTRPQGAGERDRLLIVRRSSADVVLRSRQVGSKHAYKSCEPNTRDPIMEVVHSGFDDFVGAILAAAGRPVLVEILQSEDRHVVAELRGRLGRIQLGEDYDHARRGVGWVPVGEQPRTDRGSGFWIDRARFCDSDGTDAVIRGVFDDVIYSITS